MSEHPLDCGCVVNDETGMLSKACDPHFAEFTIDIGQVMIDNLRAENERLRGEVAKQRTATTHRYRTAKRDLSNLRALLARAAEVLRNAEAWCGGCQVVECVNEAGDCIICDQIRAVLREIEGKGEA